MVFLFWIRKYNINLCREFEMYCLHLGNSYTSLGALFLPLSSHPEVVLYIAKLEKFPPSFCIWFCIWAWRTYSNKTFPPTKILCSSWMLLRCDIQAYHASGLQRWGGWVSWLQGCEPCDVWGWFVCVVLILPLFFSFFPWLLGCNFETASKGSQFSLMWNPWTTTVPLPQCFDF